jgi:hypothetical protein
MSAALSTSAEYSYLTLVGGTLKGLFVGGVKLSLALAKLAKRVDLKLVSRL